MQTIIENAQVKCQEASRLGYSLKNKHDRRLLKFAVQNVYGAIRREKVAQIIDRVKSLDMLYRELRYRR